MRLGLLFSLCLFFNPSNGLQVPRRKGNILCSFEEPVFKKKDLYNPRSLKQKEYVDALNNKEKPIVIATGPAGTGKTLFPCLKSVDMLLLGQISKIVLTRPLVTVEEDLGFLPGGIDDKMSPWTRPIFDVFLETFTKSELDKLIRDHSIEIAPLGYMRGRTFKDAVIIADEMQNSSPLQMQTLVTRLGRGSRLFITGDLNQSDRRECNGLNDIVNKMTLYYENNPTVQKLVELVALESNDVQRSKIVKQMIDMYAYDKYPLLDEDLLTYLQNNGC